MPRWARFLSCSFTGLLLSLAGFLTAVYWWKGGPNYWRALQDYMVTPAFWYLVSLFGLMMGVSLVGGRVVVHLYGLNGGSAGFLTGMLVAAAYIFFLLANHVQTWGGLGATLRQAWPDGGLFTAPFALASGFVTWLWDRLD